MPSPIITQPYRADEGIRPYMPIPVCRADALPFGEGGRAVARSGEVQENLSISHYIAANSETFSTSSVTPVGVPPSPEGKAYLPDKWQFPALSNPIIHPTQKPSAKRRGRCIFILQPGLRNACRIYLTSAPHLRQNLLFSISFSPQFLQKPFPSVSTDCSWLR